MSKHVIINLPKSDITPPDVMSPFFPEDLERLLSDEIKFKMIFEPIEY